MMSPSERAAWLELRKTGIGGSEVAALLSHLIETKYACRRRLWLEKSGVPPDYERESAPMKLGKLFEGPVCEIYSAQTGRRTEDIPRQVHTEYPELGVSVDRLVYDPEKEGPGILEAKAMMSRNFFDTKRSGVIADYLLQVQHGILVCSAALGIDIQWGSFAVGRSDDPRLIAFALEWHLKMNPQPEIAPNYLIHFDVPRDQNICNAILREGPTFWRTLKKEDEAPVRLEVDSPKCQHCAWRSCQGSAMMPPQEGDIPVVPDLTPLAEELLERRAEFDRAEELLEETKAIIAAIMGDKQAAMVPIRGALRPLYYRQQEGKPLYAAAVKDMGAQYSVLREKLIQISRRIRDGGRVDELLQLTEGAELLPVAASYIKKGKASRPLLTQYLDPKPKEKE